MKNRAIIYILSVIMSFIIVIGTSYFSYDLVGNEREDYSEDFEVHKSYISGISTESLDNQMEIAAENVQLLETQVIDYLNQQNTTGGGGYTPPSGGDDGDGENNDDDNDTSGGGTPSIENNVNYIVAEANRRAQAYADYDSGDMGWFTCSYKVGTCTDEYIINDLVQRVKFESENGVTGFRIEFYGYRDSYGTQVMTFTVYRG